MKKLIIVCEEKLRVYGDFLAQLISRNDDTEDSIMGIKDGAAAAQVWTEKDYINNAVQISSEQYILFIGNSKLIKEKRTHMQKVYSEYGMNYGWLGKQGVLFVDKVVPLGEYDSFFELASAEYKRSNQPEIARLIAKRGTVEMLPEANEAAPADETAAEVSAEIIETDSQDVVPVKPKKGIKNFLAPVGHAIVKTTEQGIQAVTKTAGNIADNFSYANKNKDLESQEYSCLVLLFYLNGLAKFLGLSEA